MFDIVLGLVFASAVAFFMIYPAMVTSRYLVAFYPKLSRWRDVISVLLTIFFALTVGFALLWVD